MEKLCYQSLILNEFESRKARNSLYSLRSFAENIGISPGRLSQILRGKSGISIRRAKEVGYRLFKDEKQIELFISLVESKQSRSKLVKQQAEERLNKMFSQESLQLSFEKFSIIRNWYHYCILEMTELSHFKSDPKWIANQLGVELGEVKKAIGRLNKLGLLDTSKEPWQQTERNLGTPNGISNYSVREHHKQILNQVYNKIDDLDLEQRYLNSTTMAIDTKKIPEAKKYLKEFRDKFCTEIQNSDSKDSVYCFSMQLFPLIKINTENKD